MKSGQDEAEVMEEHCLLAHSGPRLAFFLFKVYFMGVYEHHMHAWYLRPEEDTGSPGTRVTMVVSHCVGSANQT